MAPPSSPTQQVLMTMEGRFIPTDIIFNILVRIPASSLQRLKCVSKGWLQFISDQEFAEAHLSHHSREEFGYSVIIGMKTNAFFIGGTPSSEPKPPRLFNLPGAYGDTWILGSCNGLILFKCTSCGWQTITLHVANPITGDNLTLPSFYGHSGSIISANIGCGLDNEIKVLVVARRGLNIPTNPLICGVLTLGSRLWRKLHIPIRGSLLEPYIQPTIAGGALHWVYDTGILTLNLLEETFYQTNVNFCSYTQLQDKGDYLEWDGCFAVVFKRPELTNPLTFYRVWVMKDFEWTKFPDIDVAFFKSLGHPYGEAGSSVSRPYIATTIRNGEVVLFWQVFEGNQHLIAYDLRRREITNFTQFDESFFLAYREYWYLTIMGHINSMISCSTYASPNRTRNFAGNFVGYLGSNLKKLFGSFFLAKTRVYV